MLKFRIINHETGVVCDCDKLKPLIGHVKAWADAGTKPQDIEGVCQTDARVVEYIKEVARQWYGDNCDVCNKWVQRRHMSYIDDNHGVTMVACCSDCMK